MIRTNILPALPKAKEVTVFTKLSRQGHPFSANPNFGKSGLSKQDWALVDMEGQDVPCHLLCIVDIPEKPSKAIHLNGSLVTEGGLTFWFIVRSVE